MPRQPGNCGFVWLDGWMQCNAIQEGRQVGWLASWHTTTLLVSYLNGRTGMWPSFASVSRCRVSCMYNFITGRQYVRSTIHIGPLGILGSKNQNPKIFDRTTRQTHKPTFDRTLQAIAMFKICLLLVIFRHTAYQPIYRSGATEPKQKQRKQSVMKKYVQMR